MPTSAWRGAREGARGILCPSCWQGISAVLKGVQLPKLMGLSRKVSKREAESHLGSSRRLCSLQYVSNSKSGHRAGLRVFWDKALTALNWSNFALSPSASGSVTLTFQLETDQGNQRHSFTVQASIRTGPRVVLFLLTQASTRKAPGLEMSLIPSTGKLENKSPLPC